MIKVVKITSLWCSGCIIMNKVWNEVLKEVDIETESLDYDLDEEEVKKYRPGTILPVFIFFVDEKEIKRVTGEMKKEELLKIIDELGD